MPVNLSIKNVPDDMAERLRVRAALSHRSLQGELMAILQSAVQSPAAPPVAWPSATMQAGLPQALAQPWQRGHKSVDQIAREHRLRFVQPISTGPLAVDLVREDRDSR